MQTEAAVASKTLVSIHQTEQHHIPVECNLDTNSSDNIKSHNKLSALQNQKGEGKVIPLQARCGPEGG